MVIGVDAAAVIPLDGCIERRRHFVGAFSWLRVRLLLFSFPFCLSFISKSSCWKFIHFSLFFSFFLSFFLSYHFVSFDNFFIFHISPLPCPPRDVFINVMDGNFRRRCGRFSSDSYRFFGILGV